MPVDVDFGDLQRYLCSRPLTLPRRAKELERELRALLINEGGVDPARLVKVLNYDGSPITARFIQAELGRGMGAVDVNAAGEMAQ